MTSFDVALIPLMGLLTVIAFMVILAMRSKPDPEFIESNVPELAAALLLTSCQGCGLQLPQRAALAACDNSRLCDECEARTPPA